MMGRKRYGTNLFATRFARTPRSSPTNTTPLATRLPSSQEGKDVYFGDMKMLVATPIFTVDESETRLEGFRTQKIKIQSEMSQSKSVETTLLGENGNVVYVRLPDFSRTTTLAVSSIFDDLYSQNSKVDGVIFDLRNNYGGVIQEALMLAASIVGTDGVNNRYDRVLAYTLNSRGAFRPQDVGEFVGDPRFPGFFLSRNRVKDEAVKEAR